MDEAFIEAFVLGAIIFEPTNVLNLNKILTILINNPER